MAMILIFKRFVNFSSIRDFRGSEILFPGYLMTFAPRKSGCNPRLNMHKPVNLPTTYLHKPTLKRIARSAKNNKSYNKVSVLFYFGFLRQNKNSLGTFEAFRHGVAIRKQFLFIIAIVVSHTY